MSESQTHSDGSTPPPSDPAGPDGLTPLKRIQLAFWHAFTRYLEDRTELRPKQVRPRSALDFSTGHAGFNYATGAIVRDIQTRKSKDPSLYVMLYFTGPYAKSICEQLEKESASLEREVRQRLVWHYPHGDSSRVYIEEDMNFMDRRVWPSAFEWLLRNLKLFYKVFQPRLDRLDR
jgi:hypothetical protein